MKEVVLVLLKKDEEALGEVRCFPGLRIAENEGRLWLRGIPVSDNPDLKIRRLPALVNYFLDSENRLFPPGCFTPVGKLPEKLWVPLNEFFKVELPVSAMPGVLNEKERIRLVASDKAETGNALLTTLAEWKAYAEKAPEIRLERIRFAVSQDDRVLIIGHPIVPVPGKEYHLRDLILLPGGFDFESSVISELVSAKLNPQQKAVLLFDIDGSWEEIPLNHFVQGKRSAVRLTGERGARG